MKKWKLVDRRSFREPCPFVVAVFKPNGTTDRLERFPTAAIAKSRARMLVHFGENVSVYREMQFCVAKES